MTNEPTAPHPSPARPAAAAGGRFPFIDALRGLAVIFMIETHTVNALLDPSLRRGWFHSSLTYLNGLVAPAFLFCAGLGFAIFLARRNDDIVAFGPGFRSTLGKCLFIVLLGYSLHVPYFSLRAMLAAGPEAWTALLQVDVLQVIGASLLALLVTAVAFRTAGGRLAAVSALAVLSVAWWYLVPAGAVAALPGWLLSYFDRGRSPLFTIVPWGGFLFAGFLAGLHFAREAAAGRERGAVGLFALLSAGAIVAAAAAAAFTKPLYPPGSWWYWSAEYFLARLGSVGLVMCVLWKALGRGEDRASRAMALFGRESLPVYYIHLLIVYGKDFDWSFVRLFPEGSGYAFCALLTVLLCAAMYWFARGWSAAKRRRPRFAAWIVRGIVVSSAATFALS